MFIHEGGHGLIIVPAIILNGEIPITPTENMSENPFSHFPLGILSLLLAFPLGVIVNYLFVHLTTTQAKKYSNSDVLQDKVIFFILISFAILNLGGVLTNVFGSDFSFIVRDFLHFPSENQDFKLLLRFIEFIIFPLYLSLNNKFSKFEMSIITSITYFINYWIIDNVVAIFMPILFENFWWLFIIGLFILVLVILIILNLNSFENRHQPI
jgi:hypothetical protein